MKDFSGIICVDKPKNATSFDCCSLLKRLFYNLRNDEIIQSKKVKVGHGGTLDPMATGVLPLLLGKATSAFNIFPNQDKCYDATLKFGFTSETGDIWGKELRETSAKDFPDLQTIENVLNSFRGEILQVPPMVSALKKDGVRLYELARKGIEVEREARKVTVYSLEVSGYDREKGELNFDCHCSSGTYIRSICTDIGAALSRDAVMSGLRRTMSHGFELKDCISFEQLKELDLESLINSIIPLERGFFELESVEITPAQGKRFMNGGELAIERIPQLEQRKDEADFRVYTSFTEGEEPLFLGIGKLQNESLYVKKLFV